MVLQQKLEKQAGLNSFQSSFFARLLESGMGEQQIKSAVSRVYDMDYVAGLELEDGMQKLALGALRSGLKLMGRLQPSLAPKPQYRPGSGTPYITNKPLSPSSPVKNLALEQQPGKFLQSDGRALKVERDMRRNPPERGLGRKEWQGRDPESRMIHPSGAMQGPLRQSGMSRDGVSSARPGYSTPQAAPQAAPQAVPQAAPQAAPQIPPGQNSPSRPAGLLSKPSTPPTGGGSPTVAPKDTFSGLTPDQRAQALLGQPPVGPTSSWSAPISNASLAAQDKWTSYQREAMNPRGKYVPKLKPEDQGTITRPSAGQMAIAAPAAGAVGAAGLYGMGGGLDSPGAAPSGLTPPGAAPSSQQSSQPFIHRLLGLPTGSDMLDQAMQSERGQQLTSQLGKLEAAADKLQGGGAGGLMGGVGDWIKDPKNMLPMMAMLALGGGSLGGLAGGGQGAFMGGIGAPLLFYLLQQSGMFGGEQGAAGPAASPQAPTGNELAGQQAARTGIGMAGMGSRGVPLVDPSKLPSAQ